jgi:hypothetical protein
MSAIPSNFLIFGQIEANSILFLSLFRLNAGFGANSRQCLPLTFPPDDVHPEITPSELKRAHSPVLI